MRDTLTALAGAVILILIAALAAPPFVDWAGQRVLIDRAISGSLGVEARSDGRIDVRLLPFPRLRLDHLRLGDGDGQPGLDARFIKAELALAPLLKGEFRFTQTRIGRAELILPVGADGDGNPEAVLLPADLLASIRARDLVIEDLRVRQALVTTRVPATGRTAQVQVENLRLKAPALVGPWQAEGKAEGISGGLPFRLATTAIGPDGATVKLNADGREQGRFEADARIVLKPLAEPPAMGAGPPTGLMRAYVPEAEGTARFVASDPAGSATDAAGDRAKRAPRPVLSLGGAFKAHGALLRFPDLAVELDPGTQPVRLTGSGRLDLRSLRAGLNLETRRLDLDGLRASPAGTRLIARVLAGRGLSEGGLPVMLDLDLKAESVALGAETWSDLRLAGILDRTGGLVLRRLSATAPGPARLDLNGALDTAPTLRFTGHAEVDAADSKALGDALRTLGADGPALAFLDGRPIRGAGDVSAARGDIALGGLSLALGEARLSGSARFTDGAGDRRGRLAADLDARGIDVAELPAVGGWLPALEGRDLDLTLRARDLRDGPAGIRSGAGRIDARIQSDGPSLAVERLDIADLAGANARLKGRIVDQNGRIAGRIAGHVGAPSAAPLLSLLDRAWLPEARWLPVFLREGALDLDVSLERAADDADALRVTVKGTAAGSALDAAATTRGGRLDALDATLQAPRAGRWFGRDDLAALNKPARLALAAKRETSGDAPLSLNASGDIAGLALSTPRPVLLGPEDAPEAGSLHLATPDAAPYLALISGGTPGSGPLPADLTLALSRKGADTHAEMTGRLAGSDASASLDRKPDGALAGTVSLGALPLPGLVSALALPSDGGAAVDPAGWPQARFAPAPRLPRAELALSVGRLDLGRGLSAEKAGFALSLGDGTLALKGLSAGIGGGRITGSATLARQDGGGATLSGEVGLTGAAIEALAQTPIRGRLGTRLRFSAVGDSPAALIGNLGGSGEIGLDDLVVPGADPTAIDRVVTRLLGEDDPLREGRLQGLLAQEFAAGPLGVKGQVATSATLVGGALRSGPLDLDLGSARWSGGLVLDLVKRRIEARGTLSAERAPKGWNGPKPAVQLGFSGPWSAPQREVEAGSLGNGLAALVLQRELEKIELFDADQSERQRRRARVEMDRARAEALRVAAEKAAAEKAARERAAEEAARRARAQQAAAEEAARRDAEDAARRAPPERGSAGSEPLDIRPPAPQP